MFGQGNESVPDLSRNISSTDVHTVVRRGLRFKLVYPAMETYLRARSIDRAELRTIAGADGAIWYGRPEEPIEIPRPSDPILRETFGEYAYEYRPQTPFICELGQCQLIGPHGIVVSDDGRLVLETVDHDVRGFVRLDRYASSRRAFLKGQLRSTGGTTNRVSTPIVPLICSDWSYYHWVTEFLPKLRLVDNYALQTGTNPTILVEADPSSFVVESLDLLGYGPERRTTVDELESPSLSRVVIPMHRSHFFNHVQPSRSLYEPSRADIGWVRSRARSNVTGGQNAHGGHRVYVSRQAASRGRKVDNYAEFEAVLRRHDVQPYRLEELSFRDQVRLFSDAELVMGPIGAGLTNMMFADSPSVIELFPERRLRSNDGLVPHFYFLAQLLGFEYTPMLTGGDGRNLVVDIDAVDTLLTDVLG